MNKKNTNAKVPMRDAVAAYRAVLCRDRGSHKAVSDTLSSARSNLAVRIYPYTKGPDLTNDGLGYGERIRELNRVGKTLQRKPRMSIVTRSGRSLETSTLAPESEGAAASESESESGPGRPKPPTQPDYKQSL